MCSRGGSRRIQRATAERPSTERISNHAAPGLTGKMLDAGAGVAEAASIAEDTIWLNIDYYLLFGSMTEGPIHASYNNATSHEHKLL